jgi:uncharacterized membrane protein
MFRSLGLIAVTAALLSASASPTQSASIAKSPQMGGVLALSVAYAPIA